MYCPRKDISVFHAFDNVSSGVEICSKPQAKIERAFVLEYLYE